MLASGQTKEAIRFTPVIEMQSIMGISTGTEVLVMEVNVDLRACFLCSRGQGGGRLG